ncbi:MAG: hypothetical protein KAX28_02915, partial [Candidatus Marinimicrobia bacterium]|nr:hypothetical protein [Candidatus Neomarinimicrobiota bacterium]
MRKYLLFFVVFMLVTVSANGQYVLDNFDVIADSTILSLSEGETSTQHLNLSLETTNVHGGDGAVKVDWQNQCTGEWGGWIHIAHLHPDSLGVYDFSPYTEFSIWYYVVEPSSTPNEVDFRIILYDVGPGGTSFEAGQQEVWISQHYVLDSTPGWNQIVIPLVEGEGSTPSDGFGCPVWSGVAANGILDLNKIHSWLIEWSQGASLWGADMDSVWGTIIFDDAELQGVAPVNLVFFNGRANPGNVSMYIGWSGNVEITDEEAYTPETNSIKWTTGSGWDGVNFELDNPRNMVYNWSTDSLQFKIKAPSGLGDLLLVFSDPDEDGAEKDDYPFQATYLLEESVVGFDGTWKVIKAALKDFNRFAGCWDDDLGTTVAGEFDSTQVKKLLISGNGQEFADMAVYFDDIWTGNPEIDVVSPIPPEGISGVPGDDYTLVIWEDVPGEAGETYDVYASTSPITDVSAGNVESIATKVPEGVQTAVHYIYYPLVDHAVTYYYAVTCADGAGNVSEPGVSGAISGTATGVPTISLGPPANFAADGDLSEWSEIMPWVLKPEFNNVAAGVVDDSLDLKTTVYLAVDDDYLYVAFDVIDDVFSYSATEGSWWNWDAFEFYIGLHDINGVHHTGNPVINRGAAPDYKLVFQQDRLFNEFKSGTDPLYTPDDDNYYFEEFDGADYVGEAKIPLDSIAFSDDVRFHPLNGMKIPFDLYFHDNDGATAGDWAGNLAYSPNNTDLAWQSVEEWTYTWIGDTTHTVGIDDRDVG